MAIARAFALFAALPVAWSGPAAAQTPAGSPRPACSRYAAQIETYEAVIRDWMAKDHVPGVTVGFTRDDCSWVKGFGLADVENAVPATPASSYRYASLQKSMTAVAILQLVEQGRIDLDAPIQAYVPYFPKKEHPITVRQLLYHQGGIDHYPHPERTKDLTAHLSTREAIALFAGEPLVAVPGTQFHYSTFGYNLLGAAIEGASGQSYADYMRDHVWRPAGMIDTRMDDPGAIVPHRVRGYRDVDGQWRNSEFVDVSNRFAAGGSRGTVPDLLHFMTALNGGKLLRPESVALMYKPVTLADGSLSGAEHTQGYTMGWNLQVRGDKWFVHNDGGQQETRTFMINYPQRNFTFALAQNYEKSAPVEVVFKLYELICGETFTLQ